MYLRMLRVSHASPFCRAVLCLFATVLCQSSFRPYVLTLYVLNYYSQLYYIINVFIYLSVITCKNVLVLRKPCVISWWNNILEVC